jgi:RNA polymerase sigma factor (sigma-70 family)
MSHDINISALNDQELLTKIKENFDYLGFVFKRCKKNCINFMKSMTQGSKTDYNFEDIYQDANIVLYEKIVKGNFVLTASFQTYLNSVCRNQLLKAISNNKSNILYQDNINDSDNSMNYEDSITDVLDEIHGSKEPLFIALEKALEHIRVAGGNCYELLTLFWHQRKRMNEIAEIMGYTNGANTKHQKSRCQERLRVLAYNELNS